MSGIAPLPPRGIGVVGNVPKPAGGLPDVRADQLAELIVAIRRLQVQPALLADFFPQAVVRDRMGAAIRAAGV
ncbi:hypothetical protein [Photobacterium kasasachensis]|uniref:hypothetical protein n=1 Tax=Photobacterium kasasachensis TaxID=2910240 RepID=UPI003D0BB5DD